MTTGGPQNEIWLSTPTGTRLMLLNDVEEFSYTRVLNNRGSFSLTLSNDFDASFLKPDYRVELWYQAVGGQMFEDCLGFIDDIRQTTDQAGKRYIYVSGYDQIGILGRRIVAYDSGTSQANKSDYADDMMKAIVYDNFSTGAAARAINLDYLRIQGDFSLGPSVSKKFSRRNVLEVLQEIGASAFENGTPVYFDFNRLDLVSSVALEFQTFINQRGHDQRVSTTNSGLVFSLERGNLRVPQYDLSYQDEVNVAYVGGQGQGTDRQVVEREDTARSDRTAWSRREGFVDQRNTNETASLNAEGDALLRDGKPRMRFTGELVSTLATQYGKDWFFGDRVTANYEGQVFEGIIRAVTVRRERTGLVSVMARLEVED